MANVGVLAWWWSFLAGVDGSLVTTGAAMQVDGHVDAEVWFSEPLAWSVPTTLPAQPGAGPGVVMLWWSTGGVDHACLYTPSGRDELQRDVCDEPPPAVVNVDAVALWTDVESLTRRPGSGVFIDFSGGGVVVRCDGVLHVLGAVSLEEVDFAMLCPG